MNRLIIFRGKPTAGKSTAYATLRNREEMQDFVFVDHCAFKKELGKDKGKIKLFEELKKVLPSGRDIIIEEMSEESIRKVIDSELKKYGYRIIVFQFEVSREEAYKRDVIRNEAIGEPPQGKKWVDDFHKMHEERFDKDGILVDCDKLNKEEVVEFIIKSLNQ